jgi:hypothetical protein
VTFVFLSVSIMSRRVVGGRGIYMFKSGADAVYIVRVGMDCHKFYCKGALNEHMVSLASQGRHN